ALPPVHEVRPLSASAQRRAPHRAGAGEEIEDPRALHEPGPQDVEDRFARLLGGRAHAPIRHSESPPSKRAAYDPDEPHSRRPFHSVSIASATPAGVRPSVRTMTSAASS